MSIFEKFIREQWGPKLEALGGSADMFLDTSHDDWTLVEQMFRRLGISSSAHPRHALWRVRQAQKRGHYSGFLSRRLSDRREREVEVRLTEVAYDYSEDYGGWR